MKMILGDVKDPYIGLSITSNSLLNSLPLQGKEATINLKIIIKTNEKSIDYMSNWSGWFVFDRVIIRKMI